MDKVKKFAQNITNLQKAKEYDQFFDKQTDTIKNKPAEAFDLIVSLDIQEYTVPITYLLIPLMQSKDLSGKINLRELIMYMRRFLYEFNPSSLRESTFYQHTFSVFVKYFAFSLLKGDTDRLRWKSDN